MTAKPIIKDSTLFSATIVILIALIVDFGYKENYWSHLITDLLYQFYAVIAFAYFIRSPLLKIGIDQRFRLKGIHVVLVISFGLLILSQVNTILFYFFDYKGLNFITAVLVFIIALFDLSGRLYALDRQTLHPALVFVISFFVLICIGTLMLMLPNSTVEGISFIDALFTSTSAVCVTGLTILDTGQDFTRIGQLAIMFLIQFGALGMLSFTSLFGLLFKGFGSFENRLIVKNMINAQTLESTFKTLIQIIVFVVLAEFIGAVFIFYYVEMSFETFTDQLFFSVFHSISAFCNAGFSTLSNSMYEEGYRYNFNLHTILAVLIVLGGLGYGVIINIYNYSKNSFKYRFYRIFKISIGNIQVLKPNISLNSKIVLVTSGLLILFGGVLIFALEYNNSLKDYSLYGKVITSFFGSITARTAGFNTVDTGALSLSTIMILLLLMWIGASPGSTGGGIKTSTFAVASLNIIQQIFGLKNIIVGWKKVQPNALQRSTSIISLSLIMVGLSTFLLVTFDGHLGVMPLAFEAFSAYSTVGLSMGVTGELSQASKVVIIFTMFIGRVGFLTFLTGLVQQFVKVKYSAIDYPEEEILIN